MIKRPEIVLFISILSVSFAAIFIVSINADPLAIAFYRLFFTTLLVFPFVLLIKKNRIEIVNLSFNNLILMIAIGIILAAHFSFWISSLKLTSIASSVILVAAHPILVGPLAHFLFKEKLSFINFFGIIISIFGVIILVYGNYGFSLITMDSIEGNILALLGGLAAGLYILGGRKVRKNVGIISYAFLVYFFSTLTLFIICIIFSTSLIDLSLVDFQLILLMAVVSGILGHTLYNWSLKYIRTSFVSAALLVEPLASTIFAFIIPWINQIPSIFTIIGGLVILLGIYLTSRNNLIAEKYASV